MICINREPTLTNEPNKALCIIQADTTPETMPLNGTDVSNLDSNTKIAAGSCLYVVASGKRYFLCEDEATWTEFGVGES
jgi:hypothetical protein